MGPVEALPMVNGCILVVESVPLPVKYVATLAVVPEILAVGVPELTFKKPNLALLVDCPPKVTSTVEFLG